MWRTEAGKEGGLSSIKMRLGEQRSVQAQAFASPQENLKGDAECWEFLDQLKSRVIIRIT